MKNTVKVIILVALVLTFGVINVHSVSAKDFSKELHGVELMNAYIDFASHWIEVIEKPSNAIGIAQNSLKDLYMEKNEPERLEQILLKALEGVKDKGGRNAIRFTLAELYKNLGQAKKSSDQYIKIIQENSSGVYQSDKSVFE